MDSDALADRLAEVAAQLVGRVRDDQPEANVRWLRSQVGPEHYEALLVVLAAAVPTNQTWLQLTAWTTEPTTEPTTGPASRLRPCGTLAAYARHRERGEQPCTPCLDAKRAYGRDWMRLKRQEAKAAGASEAVDNTQPSDPRTKVAA